VPLTSQNKRFRVSTDLFSANADFVKLLLVVTSGLRAVVRNEDESLALRNHQSGDSSENGSVDMSTRNTS
jgi:hypothetical protein